MSDLKKIKDEFLSKLSGKLDISKINQIKSDLFGKSGLISTQFKKIGTINLQLSWNLRGDGPVHCDRVYDKKKGVFSFTQPSAQTWSAKQFCASNKSACAS